MLPLLWYDLRFILFETILTFLQNDFPQLKYALLGIMGLFALVQRE
jgi:hypothetical protein